MKLKVPINVNKLGEAIIHLTPSTCSLGFMKQSHGVIFENQEENICVLCGKIAPHTVNPIIKDPLQTF